MADAVAIGLRAAASAAALLAAGLPLFLLLHGHLLEASAHRIHSTVARWALIALALVLLHAVMEPVRLVGTFSGALDPSLHALLLSSDFGATMAVRTLGLLLIAGSASVVGRAGTGLALIGATLVVASFAFMGHTAADPRRWLLAPLLLFHLLAIAFWFGALGPLLTVTRRETAAVAGTVIEQFSRIALYVVPVILLAGLTMSGLLLQSFSALRTPYGLSLIAKLTGFSILMALAALNRWRLSGELSTGSRSGLLALRISITVEWILILSVVTVTAVMTALFSPDH